MGRPENDLDLLRIRNETFLSEIVYFDEIASTNTEAMQLGKQDKLTLPTLVIASRQTAGRGRGDNSWWSAEGALTFTLLLDLPLATGQGVGPVSLTIGLAMCQALEEWLPRADIGLKWPNDVFIAGKKACGILVECPLPQASRLAIGIGVNVNNSLVTAPREMRQIATSMVDESGEPADVSRFLVTCLHRLEGRLRDHLESPASLMEQWRAYCLLTGREIAVETPGTTIAGRCVGIDDEGALLIDQGAQTQRCFAGVVRIR